MDEIEEVPVGLVDRNEGQPRQTFELEALEQLAASMRDHGLLQPITVRPLNGRLEIVAGERRWRAAQLLEWEKIPAVVKELDDAAAYQFSVLENVVREDLDPIEEARALRRLRDEMGLSLAEIAAVTGLPNSQVSWRVELLNLREDIQHLVAKRQMKPYIAWYMAKLSLAMQSAALRRLNEKVMTEYEVRGLCEALWAQENQGEMFPETQISEEAQAAAREYRSALDKAAAALRRLERHEAGVIGEALAHEVEVQDERLGYVIGAFQRVQNALRQRRGRLIAGG